MEFAPLPPPLPEGILALRTTLPAKPAPVTLTGQFVRLEPFDGARHAEALFALSNGTPATLGGRAVGVYDAEALIWRYLASGPFATLAEFVSYCQSQQDAPDGRCLCVYAAPT